MTHRVRHASRGGDGETLHGYTSYRPPRASTVQARRPTTIRRLAAIGAAGAVSFALPWLLRSRPPATALGPSRPLKFGAWARASRSTGEADAHPPFPDRYLPEVRFTGTRFGDVIAFLQDVTGATFQVDWPALTATGVTPDSPVTAHLRDIKLSKALKLIGTSVDSANDRVAFVYLPPYCTLTVTTRSAHWRNPDLVTRQYDVTDLLRRSAAGPDPDETTAELEGYLMRYVDPDSWLWNAGPFGSLGVDPDHRVLTVVQLPENQEAIAVALLDLGRPSR